MSHPAIMLVPRSLSAEGPVGRSSKTAGHTHAPLGSLSCPNLRQEMMLGLDGDKVWGSKVPTKLVTYQYTALCLTYLHLSESNRKQL